MLFFSCDEQDSMLQLYHFPPMLWLLWHIHLKVGSNIWTIGKWPLKLIILMLFISITIDKKKRILKIRNTRLVDCFLCVFQLKGKAYEDWATLLWVDIDFFHNTICFSTIAITLKAMGYISYYEQDAITEASEVHNKNEKDF